MKRLIFAVLFAGIVLAPGGDLIFNTRMRNITFTSLRKYPERLAQRHRQRRPFSRGPIRYGTPGCRVLCQCTLRFRRSAFPLQ